MITHYLTVNFTLRLEFRARLVGEEKGTKRTNCLKERKVASNNTLTKS